MAKPKKTRAFVLRKVEYGDKDLIVTLLGRDTGKFSAIAKAARASRKRFGGGLQPMRCLEASFSHKSGRDLAFLREIDILEDFPGLEADFERITIASYATELVREVSQEAHVEPDVFDLLEGFYAQLSGLDGGLAALEAVLHHFELTLLQLHGALPSLYACFRCGKETEQMDKVRCIRTGEGVVCEGCRRAGEATGVLSSAAVEVLRYYHRPDEGGARALEEPEAIEQARRVIDASFEQVLDRPLKSRVMLDSVLES